MEFRKRIHPPLKQSFRKILTIIPKIFTILPIGDQKPAVWPSDFDPGEWHNVAFSADGAQLCAYVDGADAVR